MRRSKNNHMGRLIILALALAVTLPVLIKNHIRRYDRPQVALPLHNPDTILVSIDGDLEHPGIYSVAANSPMDDIISLTELFQGIKVSGSGYIKKELLLDGASFSISRQRDNSLEISTGSIPTPQRMVLGIPLDFQKMTARDFRCLPGIGPVLSERIAQYRQDNGGKLSASDLVHVQGIGEKRYNTLKKYF